MAWDELRQIIKENARAAEEEKSRPITECPECGWQGLKQNKNKELLCPICKWTERR